MTDFTKTRTKFDVLERTIHLDGSSLGPMRETAPQATGHFLDIYRCAELFEGWNARCWFMQADTSGGRVGHLIGAAPDTVPSGCGIAKSVKAIRLRQRSGFYREARVVNGSIIETINPGERAQHERIPADKDAATTRLGPTWAWRFRMTETAWSRLPLAYARRLRRDSREMGKRSSSAMRPLRGLAKGGTSGTAR